MEIEDEISGNNIKDEVRKFYLLEREWISLTIFSSNFQDRIWFRAFV
jgi:hypothetical protein